MLFWWRRRSCYRWKVHAGYLTRYVFRKVGQGFLILLPISLQQRYRTLHPWTSFCKLPFTIYISSTFVIFFSIILPVLRIIIYLTCLFDYFLVCFTVISKRLDFWSFKSDTSCCRGDKVLKTFAPSSKDMERM